jgi:pyridoxal phosphate enzyme (YggS family)
METIAKRLKSACKTIKQSALAVDRLPNDIQLLAVTKTKPVSDIMQAYEVGHRLFGENYVQEGIGKIQELADKSDIVWHFIGPLQSNKTRLVAEHFDWVQSVDRLKIAQRLNEQRSPFKQLNVCIQVNINAEPNKAGVIPSEVDKLAQAISQLPQLKLRGLMAIPAASQPELELVQSFTRMQQLFTALQAKYENIDTLSMGMSADMPIAIRYGATMVRIGSAIFGARS